MAENLEITVVILDWDYDTFDVMDNFENDEEDYYLYDISMEYDRGNYPKQVYLYGWPYASKYLDCELAELVSEDKPIYRIVK